MSDELVVRLRMYDDGLSLNRFTGFAKTDGWVLGCSPVATKNTVPYPPLVRPHGTPAPIVQRVHTS